jgi:hypothetical protein
MSLGDLPYVRVGRQNYTVVLMVVRAVNQSLVTSSHPFIGRHHVLAGIILDVSRWSTKFSALSTVGRSLSGVPEFSSEH